MLDASVVIPVLNDSYALMETLPAIRAQIDSSRVEIIVVDNGSLDDSIRVAERFGARVLREHLRRGSPYSSRNRGIEVAAGQVIILLDATCTPEPGWFEAGMASLREKKAAIVGGKVCFSFGSSRPTPAELFDSMVHVQMQDSIERHGYAMTANLFIHRDVFSRQGLFHEEIRSGEDLRWTRAAGHSGEVLAYCHEAVVRKPARRWAALQQKVVRNSDSGAVLFLGRRRAYVEMIRNLLLPPNPWRIFSLLRRRYPAHTTYVWGQVFLVSWWLRWVRAFALARAMFRFSGRERDTGALASK